MPTCRSWVEDNKPAEEIEKDWTVNGLALNLTPPQGRAGSSLSVLTRVLLSVLLAVCAWDLV